MPKSKDRPDPPLAEASSEILPPPAAVSPVSLHLPSLNDPSSFLITADVAKPQHMAASAGGDGEGLARSVGAELRGQMFSLLHGMQLAIAGFVGSLPTSS